MYTSSPTSITTTLTLVVPWEMKPSFKAAPYDRSSMRPRMYGPRSFIRTMRLFRLARLVTRMMVFRGRVRWAAVSPYMSYTSPLAVSLP
ncbi:hypothetical protein ES703_16713 [subsurface metagenome]